MDAADRSVYWNHIFSKRKDPTFIFLYCGMPYTLGMNLTRTHAKQEAREQCIAKKGGPL